MIASGRKGKRREPVMTVSELRAAASEAVNRVEYGGERIVVTRHGRPSVALIRASDLPKLAAVGNDAA